MKLFKNLAFVLFLFIATISARAQTQPARIKQGVKSGELTHHETKTLIKQQKETRQDVKEAKADGVVTSFEKKEIRHDRKKSSKAIYRKKHNNKDTK